MTLVKFKTLSRVFALISFLVFFAFSFYTLGRFSSKGSVNGVRSSRVSASSLPDIEKPEPFLDTQRGEVVSAYVKVCSNSTFGFELSYPKDWYTTSNSEPGKCTYFAPFAFAIPQVPEIDFVPIKITVVSKNDWEAQSQLVETPNEFQNIIATNSLEINGHMVTKVEAASTGVGQTARGFVKTSYLIDSGRTPLIVSYQQLIEKDDVTSYQKTLEDIVRSLKFN